MLNQISTIFNLAPNYYEGRVGNILNLKTIIFYINLYVFKAAKLKFSILFSLTC